MSEWRRVVVTGLGAVTPVGNNVSETYRALQKENGGTGCRGQRYRRKG